MIRLRKKQSANPLRQGTSKRRRLDGNGNSEDEDQVENNDIGVTYSDNLRGHPGAEGVVVPRVRGQVQESTEILSGDAALANANAGEDGLYKGQKNYAAQLPTGSAKFAGIKAPNANVRTITLVDYQPDVCTYTGVVFTFPVLPFSFTFFDIE